MKSPETSPRPMVKVTYLERQKKNASEANEYIMSLLSVKALAHQYDGSHTESSSSDVKTSSPKARGSSSRKETMNQEGKQVDNFRVPDPPLRRAGEQVLDSVKQKALPHTSKDKKLERHARSSSISSLSHVVQQMAASPSNKPPSLVGKTEPQVRSNTPETEFDDDASIAESAISISRIRRSEIERIQYFENQPDCDKIEPHRAFCTRCCKYVSLGTKQTYTVRPWEKHRSRCDQKPPRPTETADGSSVAIDKPTRRTEAERKAFLESDERAEVVEPDQVKCKKCQKWVRIFAPTVKYNLQNWNKHQLSCSGSIPSDRVAAAERKLRIVNDAQAKSFESDSVDCNLCGERVMLEGEGEYNLTKWDEHKARCVSANDNTEAKSDLPLVLASSGTKSTEINDTHSVSGTNNLKREREEDGEATDVTDVRPSTRPRNVSYEPPNNEAPGPFGWFMLPFKAFARGFRESLGGEPSS